MYLDLLITKLEDYTLQLSKLMSIRIQKNGIASTHIEAIHHKYKYTQS